MTNMNDLKNKYSTKLDQIRSKQEQKAKADYTRFLEMYALKNPNKTTFDTAASIIKKFKIYEQKLAEQNASKENGQNPGNYLINITDKKDLRELDHIFIKTFAIQTYLNTRNLNFPTTYHETPEEFYGEMIRSLDISQDEKKKNLDAVVLKARKDAADGKGIFGVHIPGNGCYINGWLCAYGTNLSPKEALNDTNIYPHILSTIAHEKLGHGFLTEYSSIGKIGNNLGRYQIDFAEGFGMHPAEDLAKANVINYLYLINATCQLTEEGWATWIESYLLNMMYETRPFPKHNLSSIAEAIMSLPMGTGNRDAKNLLINALDTIFLEPDPSQAEILDAVRVINFIGGQYDDYFMTRIHQPIKYAVGELIYYQITALNGILTAPIAGLIAENISFDPGEISYKDVESLMMTSPRHNADSRLVSISKIECEKQNNLSEFIQKIESKFSLSIPDYLKKF